MRRSILCVSFLAISLAAACDKDSTSSTAHPTATPAAASVHAPASAAPTVAAAPASPFEGEIDLQLAKPNEKSTKAIVYELRADKVRYEEGGATAPSYTIANLSQRKAYAVTDNHKDYAEVSTDATLPVAAEKVDLKRTGKTEKVAGMDCEDWQMTTSTEQIDVCAAREVAYFDLSSPAPNTATEPAWATELTKAKAFPLRLVERDKSGKEQLRVEATKVSRKTMDAGRFDVPAGYRKVALSKDTPVIGIQ